MRLLEVLLFILGGVWQGIRMDYNLLELAVIGAVVYAWRKGWRPRRMIWPNLPHPALTAAGLVLGFIALRLALIPVMRVPVPVVTDEMSHLLLADTILHGRVTNPTHPFWPHFESIHILMRPFYVSPYFPGNAVWLAAGKLLAGSWWAGVLAECAGFLLALYWMLRGWMPARWALFGVLLAGMRFAVSSYWVNNYHGGFLPALGGALIAGSFARLRKRPSLAQGLVFGGGLAILLSVRPFEGVAYTVPFAAMLAWEFRRNALPIAAALLPTLACGALLGMYCYRITGSPLVTPYQINQKTYGWPMTLAFVAPPRLKLQNIELARYYDYEWEEHQHVSGPVNLIEYLTMRLQEYWRFYLGPTLTVPLIMLGWLWRRRKVLLIGACGGLCAILIEAFASPHYLAPAAAVIIAIVVECCRHLRASRVYVVRLLPAMMALVLTLRIAAQAAGLPYTQQTNDQSWCCRVEPDESKDRIASMLSAIAGNHLVLVRPKTNPHVLLQWIYNSADIDGQRIVWARDLGPERDAELIRYYAGRHVWLVDPNVDPVTCVSYSPDNTPYTTLSP